MKKIIVLLIIIGLLLINAGESQARTEVTFYVSFGIVIGGFTLFLSFGGTDYSDLLMNEGSALSQNIESSAPCYPLFRW
ncbi:MAG: hypothetical protein ACK4TF_00765 [Thermodesulfovibrionales bacterium]